MTTYSVMRTDAQIASLLLAFTLPPTQSQNRRRDVEAAPSLTFPEAM
jgi:hypothetical protein